MKEGEEIEDLGKQLAGFGLTQAILRLIGRVFCLLFGQIDLLLDLFQLGRMSLKEGERGKEANTGKEGEKRVKVRT